MTYDNILITEIGKCIFQKTTGKIDGLVLLKSILNKL